MSEFLLLSVYTRYLEDEGYDFSRHAKLKSGEVDILATKNTHTLLVEAKWTRSPGDVYEAVGRCVKNKLAMPIATPILVMPVGVANEEVRQSIFGACYKYGIEIHFIDINDRTVYPDYLTGHVFPVIHHMVEYAQQLLEQNPSPTQIQAIRTLLRPFQEFTDPPELVDDISTLLDQLK